MRILAIDPGPEKSAAVILDTDTMSLLWHEKLDNDALLRCVAAESRVTHIVIEKIESYGKPVGQDVFTTVFWCGRFWESAIRAAMAYHFKMLSRRAVKMHLCDSVVHVNDAVIRQRIIDMWGGKEQAIGKKATPGKLYGVKADEWQALALAVTHAETIAK